MKALPVVLLLTGSLTAVVGAGRTWLSVQIQDPVLGTTAAQITGSAVTGTVGAAGLLAVAATLVSLLTRGAARRTGLVLALLAGGWLLWAGVRVAVDPAAAARSASRSGGSGTPGALLGPEPVSPAAADYAADATLWPLVVATAGLVTMCGVAAGVWSGRHAERPVEDGAVAAGVVPRTQPSTEVSPPESDGPDATARVWEDLSAGRDPTDDDTDRTTGTS